MHGMGGDGLGVLEEGGGGGGGGFGGGEGGGGEVLHRQSLYIHLRSSCRCAPIL